MGGNVMRNMMTLSIRLVPLGLAVFLLFAFDVQAETIAKVNGVSISSDRLDRIISSLSAQEQQRARSTQGMQILLQQVIAEEVMYQEAKLKDLDRLTRVLDIVAQARRDAMVEEMANFMLEEQGNIEAIRKHYTANKSSYKKVRASHILVDTPDDIEKARAMLEQGADFAAVAKKISKDPSAASNGGDLGFFTHQTMVPAFADAVFSMKVNELKGPIQTKFGYHLIRLQEIQEPKDFDTLGENDRQLIRRELFQHQLDTLHSKASIDVDDNAVNQYINNIK